MWLLERRDPDHFGQSTRREVEREVMAILRSVQAELADDPETFAKVLEAIAGARAGAADARAAEG